jgi:putative membrane protein
VVFMGRDAEENAAHPGRSVSRGLLAGLAGGVAGTIAMTFAERMFPPRSEEDEQEPTELLAEKVAGHELSPETREVAAEGIEWGLGIAAGAVYGVLAEYYPAATSKDGTSFGIAMEALTHEKALPALGLLRPKEDQSMRERASEMTSFVVYGIATETVRRFVRKRL